MPTSAAAQNYNLTVSLEDKDTGEPVGFATVSVTPEGKTKATKYSLSDSHGKARIEGIKAGKYTVKAELMGYKAFEQEVNVSKTADLGIFKMEQDKQNEAIASDRRSQVGSGDRSEKIRTYNFPQDRVTDHRIHYSRSNIPAVMDGDIEDLIRELVKHERSLTE